MPFDREIEIALQAAKAAGEIALSHQAKGLEPIAKPDLSPVTAADHECERHIAGILENAFPEDGLLGEEGASKESHNGRRWIIDPIDGTRDFIRRLPLWCVLIALEEHGEVKAGVAHFPPLNQTYWAARGGGAFCNGGRLKVSKISDAASAVLSLNGINKLTGTPRAAAVLDWAAKFWAVRSLAGTLDAVLLAAGDIDVWIEASPVHAWDLAAPQVLIEEAGGVFFDFKGQRSIYGGACAACTPALERELRTFLALPGN